MSRLFETGQQPNGDRETNAVSLLLGHTRLIPLSSPITRSRAEALGLAD